VEHNPTQTREEWNFLHLLHSIMYKEIDLADQSGEIMRWTLETDYLDSVVSNSYEQMSSYEMIIVQLVNILGRNLILLNTKIRYHLHKIPPVDLTTNQLTHSTYMDFYLKDSF
jgi:hypothetical protein